MAEIYSYNPKKVTVALGTHMVTGYADDSFITIELSGDGTQHVVGCDGEIVRSIDPSDVYTMKLTVLQNSRTNQFLNNKYEEDKANGNALFPVTIVDILGEEEFSGTQGWIAKPASWQRGKTQENREWEITIAQGKLNIR